MSEMLACAVNRNAGNSFPTWNHYCRRACGLVRSLSDRFHFSNCDKVFFLPVEGVIYSSSCKWSVKTMSGFHKIGNPISCGIF